MVIFLFTGVYCYNLIILLLFIFDMITLCLEILSILTVSISSFYTHPSSYSIETALVAVLMLTNLMVFFFFFIELFSSSSTIHYHHHHSFLKQSPLSHVQYTELCVTSWIFSVSFFCSIFSTKSLNLGVPPNQHRTSFLSYLHILPMFL